MDVLSHTVVPFARGLMDTFDVNTKNDYVHKKCGALEMDSLECLEAYGIHRGRHACKSFVNDFRECVHGFMQSRRISEMRLERARQLMRGERKVGEFFDPIHPPRDGYQPGPFYN